MNKLIVTNIIVFAASVGQCWGGPAHSDADPVTFGDLNAYETTAAYSMNQSIAQNAATQDQVNGQAGQINALNDRLDKLDGMKMLVEADVRVYDGKRFAISLFNSYDAAHASNFAAGTRITLKLGPSYEERLLAAQAKQIAALEAMLKGGK